MKHTIHDVAKLAEVSPGTVSRVLNDYKNIKQDTKNKVLKAVKTLNYLPNAAARKLSSKNVRTIAMLLSEVNIERGITLPFELLSGILKFTDNSDYEFIFYTTNIKKQQQKTLQQFCYQHNITGIIICGLRLTDPYYSELNDFSTPCVVVDMEVQNPNIGTASIDNITASFEVVKMLVEHNHKRILFLNGRSNADVSIKREIGFKKGLQAFNLPIDNALIQYANFNEEIAYLITKEALNEHLEFSAIFAASDIMALGSMRALNEHGKRIPKDCAVVGFDDIIVARYMQPSLSSVQQDMQTLGFKAAKLLSEIIEHKATKMTSLAPHKLIKRSSV